jgi:predicted DsbA family dithiol-disulfide isomerase
MKQTILIQAYIDITCPYCYIGKRQLDKACAQLSELNLDTRWLPYQLSPDTPAEGKGYHQRMTEIIGSVEKKDQALAGVREMGLAAGIDLRLDLVERMPNTLLAHCLIQWSEPGEQQDKTIETLFNAYFTEGQFLGDKEVLLSLGRESGLSDDCLQQLDDFEATQIIFEQADKNRQIGFRGVPAFIVNQKHLIQGAQDSSVFVRLFEKLKNNPP